jgi:ribosomal protein S18 acetylase RimI-like enzyme
MLSGISYAIEQGAKRARVGVWRQNRPALALYEGLGFVRRGQRIFLAHNV